MTAPPMARPLANHEPFGAQGPCFANMNILLTSPGAFDGVVTHPSIYPLARRLMGDAPSARFSTRRCFWALDERYYLHIIAMK